MATKPITRTILGSQMMSRILIGKEHVLIPNTTLNERFNINADAGHADCIAQKGKKATAATTCLKWQQWEKL